MSNQHVSEQTVPRYVVELEPVGDHPAGHDRSLARLLKYALRACGWRCRSVRAVQP
jgi:hypothetical protein